MGGKSVCLSAPSSTFPVAWSRTPIAAFESLGFGYVPPPAPMGSLRSGDQVAGSSFPADSAKFVSLLFAQLRGDIWWMTAT